MRNQFEANFRLNLNNVRELVRESSDIAVLVNTRGAVIVANRGPSGLSGESDDDASEPKVADVIVGPVGAAIEERLPDVFESGRICRFTDVFDGNTFRTTFCPLVEPFGSVHGVAVFVREISDADKAREALRTSEDRYLKIIRTAPDIIYVTDAGGFFTLINPTAAQLTGYTEPELIGKHYLELVRPDHVREVERFFGIQFVKELPETYLELPLLTKSGQTVWIGAKTQLVIEGDKVVGFQAIGRDITERKRAEDALRQSEEKYRAILESIEEGYYEVDLAGNMVFCNDAMGRILGYSKENLIGLNNREFMDAEIAQRVFHVFNRVHTTSRPERIFGWELIRKDGARRDIEASVSLMRDADGEPTGFRGIIRDITERKQLEQQLAQAQKMEAIGALAGGIAHDFNNILFAITGYAEMALEDAPENSTLRSDIEQILEGAERARDLVNQILTFSRHTDEERRPLDIAPIVKEAFKFLRASIPATIDMQCDVAPDTGVILSRPTQIHQVLMNLCSNSAHAMMRGGGILRVELKNVSVSAAEAAASPDLREGRYLRLVVQDTGCGMEPRLLERIFDPYFTTKPQGEGTGLGLAVVHGVVKSHEGAIEVRSKPGEGTTVSVFFPLVSEPATGPAQDGRPIPSGHGLVLFVDDEPPLVQLGSAMLERLGYDVVALQSSEEALEIFRSKPDDFDLVITDLSMPGLSGKDLAAEIRRVRADLPIIVSTGFHSLITDDDRKNLGIAAVLKKPVLTRELAEVIDSVLKPNF